MKVGTERPAMNTSRACMLATADRYVRRSHVEDAMAADGPSLLEIQKLMYFLQEAGQAEVHIRRAAEHLSRLHWLDEQPASY